MKQHLYHELITNIDSLLAQARQKAYIAVNNLLVQTYWDIGKQIVEYEQKGVERADYGAELLPQLSKYLESKHGKGFSRSNLQYMRLFYIKYPKYQTLSGKLSWSHYIELLMISEDLARAFYEKQCEKESWSLRELRRQVNSLLFERIALSKDKAGVLELSKRGQIIEKPEDTIKSPYILEFLGLEESKNYSETELENVIISKLKDFILELGRDFLFVERQKRITLENRHYYIDLVFYHRILRCFVLVDIKLGELTHADSGQMNFYLNYYKKNETTEREAEPIGLILCASKNKEFAEYIINNKTMFASEYKLKLPSEKVLKEELKKLLS